MGPGLFLAVFLALALPVRAERAVGLDAQGVDPMSALSNPSGLDVRDALGRPVSARLVASELKQAQAKAASEAAFASRLPKAAAIAAMLEMIETLRLFLKGGSASLPPQRLFALAPTQRSGDKAATLQLIVIGLALLVAAYAARPKPAPQLCRVRSTEVLRC